jgi:hypothetical protein
MLNTNSTSRAVQGSFKQTERIRTVRPNPNMKDVLLLHNNARPHTRSRTREAIAKMGWTVLPHPAHSPDLAHYDCHLFGPVPLRSLRGRYFAANNELKQSFRDVLRSRGGEFYNTGTQHINLGKSVLKMIWKMWKSSPVTATDVRIIHVNFIVIAIIFSEKK